MPTSELPADGGVSAPSEVVPDGAAAAPVVEPAPPPVEPAPPAGAPPVEAVPTVPAGDVSVPDETAALEEPPAVEEDESGAVSPGQVEPNTATQEEPVEDPAVPTSAEVLSEAKRPLVPVAILSAPVESASEGEPLIAEGEILAAAAQQDEGEGEPQDDDDEVIIPVDPGDEPDDGEETPMDGEEDGTLQPDGAPQAVSRGDRLALTGLATEGPLGAGIVLFLLGTLLRITARPTSAPVRV